MERKIGEIFEFGGEWYQCTIPINGCDGCSFRRPNRCASKVECLAHRRSDHKSVIFKKLEKVGEPYISSRNKKRYQLYRCFCLPIITEDRRIEIGDANWVGIEIKQTKEDVEEKKLNLKPFDLEAAKAGKPVCTRDGRKARIICFDRDWDMHIVALVADPLGESVHYYLSNGKVDFDKQNDEDLMMLSEKKEGWVNVYREESNNNERLIEQTIYKTRKDAFDNACPKGYITTIKINWEE